MGSSGRREAAGCVVVFVVGSLLVGFFVVGRARNGEPDEGGEGWVSAFACEPAGGGQKTGRSRGPRGEGRAAIFRRGRGAHGGDEGGGNAS